MIVRSLADLAGTEREVDDGNWESRRLLLARDGVPFSMHDTIVRAGTATEMWYAHHLEAVYCVSGSGSLEDLDNEATHSIEDGTLYALDGNERHILRAVTDLRLICVFSPPLVGREVHDENGAYPLLDSDADTACVPERTTGWTGWRLRGDGDAMIATSGMPSPSARRRSILAVLRHDGPREVIEHAVQLAQDTDADLVLLKTVDSASRIAAGGIVGSPLRPTVEPIEAQLVVRAAVAQRRAARSVLDNTRDDIERDGGIPGRLTTVIVEGALPTALDHALEQHQYDLVVLAQRRRSWLSRLFSRADYERVLKRHEGTAVLLVDAA